MPTEEEIEVRREKAARVIRELRSKCKSSFFARDRVGDLTGGALSSRHMANLDSQGKGPKGAFKIGRKKCYPTDNFCDFLIDRLEV